MEVSPWHLWLLIVALATLFLAGLTWCFCCGTCVGRSLLRETGLLRFFPGVQHKRHWRDHVPADDVALLDEDDEYNMDSSTSTARW